MMRTSVRRTPSGSALAISVVCFLFCTQILTAQSSPSPETVVQFELYHNRVYVPVMVNGAGPFTFVLDTGAALSGVNEDLSQTLHLKTKGTASLVGNGQQKARAKVLKDVELTMGTVSLHEPDAIALPLQELEGFEGHRVDGVLGIRLFREHVVEIDYAAHVLRVFSAAGYVYDGSGEPVPLHLEGGAALFDAQVEITPGKAVTARLAIDLGTYSPLRLYRRFVEDHRDLLARLDSRPSLGFGIGGEFPESLVRVTGLSIGHLNLANPFAELSEATGGATSSGKYSGTIGGDILRRFTVTLDYVHSQAFFEPNATFGAAFEADLSGVTLVAEGADLHRIVVHRVFQNSAASQAGLQAGDIISSINGISAEHLGIAEIYAMFRKAGAYTVIAIRNGHPISLTLQL